MSRLHIVLIAAGLMITAGLLWLWLPLGEWLAWVQFWILSLGVWGLVAFVVLYSVVTVVMVPALPLTLTAGLVYGIWGFPLAVVSATLAACIAFLIARYFMHDRVAKLMGDNIKFEAVKRAVSNESWKIVVLLRLSPALPFAVQNYLLGITDIRFVPYMIASFIGMMPACALYVYIGSLGMAADSGGPWKLIFLALGTIATVAVFWLIVRRARQTLDQIDSNFHNTRG